MSLKPSYLLMLLAFVSSMTMAQRIIDEPNVKAVGNARWHKQESVDARSLSQRSVPQGQASLFFVREMSGDGLQTSLNIAINDRFQVSLQPAHFSQVNSCSGLNDISLEITGNKNNDLLYQAKRFDLQSQGAYFFMVRLNALGQGEITPVSHEQAINYIAANNLQYQTHQISRVVPNCALGGTPAPMNPIAKEPISMNLQVLFDTDKSDVKPMYYSEIQRVASFMQQNPNVSVVIEGHTDSRASDSYNHGLSQRRVDAVRMVLINQFGIAANRVSSVSYGETRPIASNNTAQGRQQNRRVVAVFSGY